MSSMWALTFGLRPSLEKEHREIVTADRHIEQKIWLVDNHLWRQPWHQRVDDQRARVHAGDNFERLNLESTGGTYMSYVTAASISALRKPLKKAPLDLWSGPSP